MTPALLGRVPTGRIDEIVTVAVDWTATVPLLVIPTLRRNPAEVSDRNFRPVHTTAFQIQYAELPIEHIRAALTRRGVSAEEESAA